MGKKLEGKIAVITGGNSGIGLLLQSVSSQTVHMFSSQVDDKMNLMQLYQRWVKMSVVFRAMLQILQIR